MVLYCMIRGLLTGVTMDVKAMVFPRRFGTSGLRRGRLRLAVETVARPAQSHAFPRAKTAGDKGSGRGGIRAVCLVDSFEISTTANAPPR